MNTTQQAALLSADELDALRQQAGGALNFVTLREFRAIAKAVTPAILAKLQATQEPVQAGELPGAPERIWLQVNPEGDASDTGYPADHEGVTWCWHSIGGQEVEYVRADRAALSARKPLSGHEARELVSIHQKAVFELAKDMSDDNHKAVVSARLALLHELCPNGIGLKVKP
jgi:hypothetical protein